MSTFKINKGVVDNLESSLSGKSSTDLDNLSQTGEAHFTNPDLSNLSSTGEAKIKSNIQLVNEVPAQPETGVLYVIPES